MHEKIEEVRVDAVGETVLRDVFGAWEELPQVWRDVFTSNGQALLAEIRGGNDSTTTRGSASCTLRRWS